MAPALTLNPHEKSVGADKLGLSGVRGMRIKSGLILDERNDLEGSGGITRLIFRAETPLAFCAGQWIKVRVDGLPVREEGGQDWATRSYSLCSEAPLPPGKAGDLEIMVRRIPGGKVSPVLSQGLGEGVKAKVVAVGGNFNLPLRPSATSYLVLMVAGGVGITPFLSMLRTAASHAREGLLEEAGVSYEVILLYSTRAGNIPCEEETACLEEEFPAQGAGGSAPPRGFSFRRFLFVTGGGGTGATTKPPPPVKALDDEVCVNTTPPVAPPVTPPAEARAGAGAGTEEAQGGVAEQGSASAASMGSDCLEPGASSSPLLPGVAPLPGNRRGCSGRLTKLRLEHILGTGGWDPRDVDLLTCGPTQMMKDVLQWGQAIGVPADRAKGEWFNTL